MGKKALTLFCTLILLIPLLSLPFVEFASANFYHYAAPKITVISPLTDMIYSQSNIPLSVKIEMQNWNMTDWEQLAEVKYSLDGQPDVAVPVTNEIKNNGNGLATVNGLATTTISGVAKGAHSLYIQGQTTFSQHSSLPTRLSITIYFIVNTATPTIQVLSPQQTTYNSINVPLEYKSDKLLSWAGYSLDQNLVIASIANTTLVNLSNGAHSLRVYGNDSAGNVCTSQAIVFTINGKNPPSVIIDVEKIISTRKFLPSDFQDNTYWQLIFHVSEPTSWMGYSMDGSANQTIEGNITLGLSYGSHTIIVYAKDVCGNAGSSTHYTFVLGKGEAGSAYASPTAAQTPPPELTFQPNPSNILKQQTPLDLFTITLILASVALVAIVAFTSVFLFKRNYRRKNEI